MLKTRTTTVVTAVLAFAAIGWETPVLATTVRTDFEDGTTQGWSFEGDVDTFTIETDGPPGSTRFLQLVDLGQGPTMVAVAPAVFHGDWTEFENGGVLSADVGLLSLPGGGTFGGPVLFRISGPGGSAVKAFGFPPIGRFVHYSAPIRESEWIVESGTWAGLIRNVTGLRINAEYATGFDRTGIDNVVLSNDFSLDWYTVDGGGGMATTSGDFELSGTIGQPDATRRDEPMADAESQIELVGGFWPVAGSGSGPGDCDIDGDVDLADYAAFAACLQGPVGGVTVGCECFDLDGNGRIDLRDFAAFTRNFTG